MSSSSTSRRRLREGPESTDARVGLTSTVQGIKGRSTSSTKPESDSKAKMWCFKALQALMDAPIQTFEVNQHFCSREFRNAIPYGAPSIITSGRCQVKDNVILPSAHVDQGFQEVVGLLPGTTPWHRCALPQRQGVLRYEVRQVTVGGELNPIMNSTLS